MRGGDFGGASAYYYEPEESPDDEGDQESGGVRVWVRTALMHVRPMLPCLVKALFRWGLAPLLEPCSGRLRAEGPF